jgi:hypothetical protein
MTLPIPTIGSVSVRGYVLPDTCGGDVCALMSLYGFYSAYEYNPLVFFCFPHLDRSVLPTGTEILFDVIAGPQGEAMASNIRRA